MKHETHTQHIMRDTDSFYVRLCGCGVVHLCFGATTLNLSDQALIAVTETLKSVTQEIIVKSRLEKEQTSPSLQVEEAKVIQGKFQ